MRPWVLLRQAGIDFEEVCVRFDSFAPDSQFKAALKDVNPVGKVPVLVHDGLAVWDTLAIAEYVAEQFPDKQLWPQDRATRARARSICAEMHSGFTGLRSACPMNIEAHLPEIGALALRDKPAVRADLERICSLWRGLLQEHGGPMLFGQFTVRCLLCPGGHAPENLRAACAFRCGGLHGARECPARREGLDRRRFGRKGLHRLRRALPIESLKAGTGMQVFVVGGAVRDALMGLAVNDRDWVVVGSTPEAMSAQGYLPVGKDFPVFLHPQTREEYALARTERKTARGYKGFAVQAAPDVTLEEDLARRDLTVNAMAVPEALAHQGPNAWTGQIVDPYGGQRDLQAKVLRHVTEAFAEDPVRILRLARFAARFADFSVADETMALMRQMVEDGEVDHLVPERVWQELAKGLMSERPSRMLEVLRECGALKVLLPELDRLWGVPQRPEYHPEIDTGVHMMLVMDMSARLNMPLPVRVACLMHDLGKGTTPADVLPRHIGHEGAQRQTLAKSVRAPARTERLQGAGRSGGA